MNKNLKTLLEQAGYYPDQCDPIKPNFHDVEKLRYLPFTDILMEYCANIVQDCVDLRIPASEYPNIIRNHFKEDK